jgi:arsenate reductase
VIWHNPRCSKSRETLALIEGYAPQIRLYLQDPPSLEDLRDAAERLGSARALLRAKEDGAPAPDAEDAVILAALAANPKLIERPLVLHKTRAAIGRPPQSVLDLFS